MHIFEMSGTMDLHCFNISSSKGDMASPTKKRLGKEVAESSIEGVAESPIIFVSHTTCNTSLLTFNMIFLIIWSYKYHQIDIRTCLDPATKS